MCVASLPEALTLCLDRAAAQADETDAPANIEGASVPLESELTANQSSANHPSADQGSVRENEPLPREVA
jgi:hypothetical protein